MKEDSYCRLDPDGKGPLLEFKVLCNMTKSKDAVTIVNHTTSAKQVNIRDEAYTYSRSARSWVHKLNYGHGDDFKNLRAMIDESDHCRQYVEFNCINTKFLTPRENDLPGAYWVSDTGVENHYWGGAKLGGVTCACGTTSSCHDKKKMCNCDTGDAVWRQDAGTCGSSCFNNRELTKTKLYSLCISRATTSVIRILKMADIDVYISIKVVNSFNNYIFQLIFSN